jgi:3-isopropylmalate/(R)-2-methylmalate dehydratase small subunit
MSTILKGNAVVITGEHINVDTAMGWYLGMDTLPPEELALKFMVNINPEIPKIVKQGDILVCGRNFGFGKAHQSLFYAMGHLGIKCIVAHSFSTQMLQTALVFGINMVECPDILNNVSMCDEIEVDVENAVIKNITKNKMIEGKKFPSYIIEVMQSGGQFGYLAKKIAARK